jgi:hypothetical protein
MARQAAWDSAYAQMGFSWSFSSPFAWLPNCSDFGRARAMAWRGARENAHSQTTLKASGMHVFHHSPLFLGSFCFVYPVVANSHLKMGAAHGLVHGRTLMSTTNPKKKQDSPYQQIAPCSFLSFGNVSCVLNSMRGSALA